MLAPGNHRDGLVIYPVARRASIKDVIEALGPPHTEIGRIQGPDGDWGFGRILAPGDSVRIFPPAPPVDPRRQTILISYGLAEVKFAVDANVGRLATYLRLLGFDTLYSRSMDDGELVARSVAEGRILLSKDRSLLKRKDVIHGKLIRAEDPREQVREVLDHYGLTPPFRPFSRCLRCNEPLRPVAKDEVLDRLEPLTRKYFEEFHLCPACDQVYWAGSHHDRMLEWLDRLERRED